MTREEELLREVNELKALLSNSEMVINDLMQERDRLKMVIRLGLEVPVFRCMVTELYPEHNEDCSCKAHDAFLECAKAVL